ncbi:MAG: phosphatidate phosphatase App1 family protein [Woeseiaceae bacterium]
MRKFLPLYIFVIFAGYLLYAANTDGRESAYSDIADDEVIVFFRTAAWLDEDDNNWHVPIHGWIYEPEDSTTRKALFAELVESEFDLAPSAKTEANFSRRFNLLIADNERNKQIVIDIAGEKHSLPPSAENGHFESTFVISQAEVAEHIQNSHLGFSAVTGQGDTRKFVGDVVFVNPTGLSVISDIDDTVKISNVTNKKELLNHTFFLDFAAAPGMASLYDDWAERDASFHFVSSSPWQLYSPLQELLDAEGFPRSTLSLKAVRFRDDTLLDLFKKGTETKPAAIESVLANYPGRQFVLVGDSGEQDPEVYAAILQKYPEQILRVYIRNVTQESASNERFTKVFENVDPDLWSLFDDPSTLVLP